MEALHEFFAGFSGWNLFAVVSGIVITAAAFLLVLWVWFDTNREALAEWLKEKAENFAEETEAWSVSIREEIGQLPPSELDWADPKLVISHAAETGRKTWDNWAYDERNPKRKIRKENSGR